MTVVGIVSPGAMGSAVGTALRSGGARVVATLEGRSERTAGLGRSLELVPSLDEVVGVADVVLSIVPPAAAAAVAADLAAAAARTGVRPLVADLNAIAPGTAHALAGTLGDAAVPFVDGSISGRPPTPDGRTIVYLSGARVTDIASLPAPGIDWIAVGAEIGQASAVKMSTASVYKGQSAVFVQALRTAHANGVLAHVLADLERAYPDLVGRASPLLQRVASVSGRYVGEMEQISAAQEAAGLTPALFEALAEVYRELERTPLAKLAPEDVDPGLPLEDVLGRV